MQKSRMFYVYAGVASWERVYGSGQCSFVGGCSSIVVVPFFRVGGILLFQFPLLFILLVLSLLLP
jgi:hypothetical protein